MTVNCDQVETGRDGGFPVQIHLPQEETLIQVVEDETHVLYDQVSHSTPNCSGLL